MTKTHDALPCIDGRTSMTRTETDKWTSWYLSLVFAGVEPSEAGRIIAEIRDEQEAKLNAVGSG